MHNTQPNSAVARAHDFHCYPPSLELNLVQLHNTLTSLLGLGQSDVAKPLVLEVSPGHQLGRGHLRAHDTDT